VGNGDERAGQARRPELRRVLARLRDGGLVFEHPVRRSVLQLFESQLRPALRSESRTDGPVLPRRLVEKQSGIPGRVPVLDRRGVGQPQRRVFRHYDAGDPMDPKAEDHKRGEELRTVEGKVRGGRTAGLLGTALVQTHQQRGARGDHQPADVRPMPEQLPVAKRSDRRRVLLIVGQSHENVVPRSHHTHTHTHTPATHSPIEILFYFFLRYKYFYYYYYCIIIIIIIALDFCFPLPPPPYRPVKKRVFIHSRFIRFFFVFSIRSYLIEKILTGSLRNNIILCIGFLSIIITVIVSSRVQPSESRDAARVTIV